MPLSIVVVGGGVVGLTTAWHLAQRGHRVRLLHASKSRRQTSPVAAAFWYPYAVSLGLADERRLAEPTFNFLADIAARHPESGCRVVEGVEYFDASVCAQERKIPWWKEAIPATRHRELSTSQLPRAAEGNSYPAGWSYRLPVVDMARFLPWLEGRFVAAGGMIEEELVRSLDDLELHADLVVNCTGGWATRLTRDDLLYPLKGVVVRVSRWFVSDRLVFLEKGKSAFLPTYIVPHETHAVLGGTVDEPNTIDDGGRWPTNDGDLWSTDDQTALDIVRRCAEFAPRLQRVLMNFSALRAAGKIEVHVGLRPRRREQPPRIEREQPAADGPPIIHNYGHGGAGLTLSWGSAQAVAELIDGTAPPRDANRDRQSTEKPGPNPDGAPPPQ